MAAVNGARLIGWRSSGARPRHCQSARVEFSQPIIPVEFGYYLRHAKEIHADSSDFAPSLPASCSHLAGSSARAVSGAYAGRRSI
jgi:hypothetical protein